MPRFFYTSSLASIILLLCFLYLLFFVPPEEPKIILLFFTTLHLAITFFLTTITFLIARKGLRREQLLNKLYKKHLRRAFIITALPVWLLALRAFDLNTLVNQILLALTLIIFYGLTETKTKLPSQGSL